MDMKKRPITDLIQIPFASVSMMFCHSRSMDQSYTRFYSLNRDQIMDQKKASLLEDLKISFRMSNPNVDDIKPPGFLSSRPARSQSKELQTREKQQSIQSIRLLKKHPQPTVPEQTDQSREKEELYVSMKQIPYDLFNHIYQEFEDLRLKNDGYIKDFNLLPEHKGVMLMEVFMGQCPYIKSRRTEIKERIRHCLGYSADKKHIVTHEYIEFRMLVNCAVDRHTLLRFLMSYL